MKKRISIIFYLLLVIAGTGCSDFLDRTPLDAIPDDTFFEKESDFKYYANGLYNNLIRKEIANKWINLNDGTDDLITSAPNEKLMRHSFSGMAELNNKKGWNDAFDYIRDCNYMIVNSKKMQPITKVAYHYLGEGYYCRASKYFDLLQTFGGVPYIDNVLTVDDPNLYRPRDSRHYVAQRILADLDSAIMYLDWQGAGEAGPGRINKNAALVLKTRAALFEGSWQHYHKAKGTKFQSTESNGIKYLEEVIKAGEQLIAKHGKSIFTGSAGNEYFDYFNQMDYNGIPGAFLYRVYSVQQEISHNWGSLGVAGVDCGVTKDAIDSYLMRDGKPAEISSLKPNGPEMEKLFILKDSRLEQTIWHPGKGTFADYWSTAIPFKYPGLIQVQQRLPSYSGYRIMKGLNYTPSEYTAGEADDLILRYEEGLMNYAEAKAILGNITQADLDKTVNLFRKRVNMPEMKLTEVNSWNVNYLATEGYDPSATNIVNELRRERRVEFMLEGTRLMDLKRWALYENVFNGKKPVGAYLQEFITYWNAKDKDPKFKLTKGKDVDDINGFINPFFKNADFKKNAGRGYYVDKNRDYLDAIPAEEINLYKNKANVILEQNPGWF